MILQNNHKQKLLDLSEYPSLRGCFWSSCYLIFCFLCSVFKMSVYHMTFWSTGISGFILDGLLQLYRPTDINSHYHGYLYVLIPQVFLSFIDSLFWLDDYFNSNRWNIYGVVVNTLLKLADFVLHHTFVYIIRNKSANSESRRIGCSILCNILRCR
jgi:hypothetical protein